jgi:urea transport system substrate-binding protein
MELLHVLRNPVNTAFKKEWAAYVQAHNLPGGDKRVTNDPMEATYVGIHMWKQAVEKAGTTDVDKVIEAAYGQKFNAPCGFELELDANHHLHKPVFIGEIIVMNRGEAVASGTGATMDADGIREMIAV